MQMNVKNKLVEILGPIDPYMQRVDEEIKVKMKTGLSLIDDGAFHLFKKGGKKIRAALIILCSGLKNSIPDDVIEVAAAAEIVHAATLIHDDIIDESTMRRGELTVSKKYGNRVAVLVGDYLYTRALEVAVGSDRLDLFPIMVAATRDMVKGELYQIEYSSVDRITKEHYFRIIEMKTARFMAACAKLGGVKSRMSEEESERLYQFGLNLGFAFQIVDDTLDVVDTIGISGKDSGNDFINGKITLPFLHLLEVSGGKERKELEGFAKAPDARNWAIVRERIIGTGAVEHCIGISGDYVRKALNYLDFFQPSRYKDIILNLANFLLERNY